jgi:hypothetical protein
MLLPFSAVADSRRQQLQNACSTLNYVYDLAGDVTASSNGFNYTYNPAPPVLRMGAETRLTANLPLIKTL